MYIYTEARVVAACSESAEYLYILYINSNPFVYIIYTFSYHTHTYARVHMY